MSSIQTAEDAVRVAQQFIQPYYPFKKLHTAKQENGAWLVEFDIGVLRTTIIRLILDGDSGKVLEFITLEST